SVVLICYLFFCLYCFLLDLHSFPTRRSSDLCLFAPEVLAGGAVHPVTSVSTHLLFQDMDNSWNQKFHSFLDDPGYVKELIRYQKDRKSTRLNSSHVSISYAVFCLKKKKMKDR